MVLGISRIADGLSLRLFLIYLPLEKLLPPVVGSWSFGAGKTELSPLCGAIRSNSVLPTVIESISGYIIGVRGYTCKGIPREGMPPRTSEGSMMCVLPK